MKRSKIKLKKGWFIVFASFLWLLPSVGKAQTVVTCPGPGTPLQTAINAAGTGATLLVSGTCYENVSINEDKDRITLDGQNSAIISGLPANSATSATILIRGGGIVIKNFASITGGRDGILVLTGGAAVILNNTINGNYRHGVNVNENSTARIGFQSVNDPAPSPNNIQDNLGRGVSVTGSSNARIAGNTISTNGDDGVGVFSVSHADVSDNNISANGGDGITVGQNSGVNLGNDTGATMFDLPNATTTPNNSGFGIRCFINSYADGRLGTLNGLTGPKGGNSNGTAFSPSCVDSLL